MAGEGAGNGAGGGGANSNAGGAGAGTGAGAGQALGTPGGSGAPAGGGGAGAGQAGSNQVSSGAGGSGQGGAPDWTASLGDNYKGLVQNKGWKGVTDALDSYQNLEKLVGAPPNEVIKLPKSDDAQAWEQVYSRLGRPQNAEGYKLQTPKEGGNPEFTKWAQETFFKLGLSEKQGQQLSTVWTEYVKAQQTAAAEAKGVEAKRQSEALQREWGSAFQNYVATAQLAARGLGLDASAVTAIESAIGYQATMKMLQGIGTKLSEGSFVVGDSRMGGNAALPPAAAKQQIKELQADPTFRQRLSKGDGEAVAKWTQLHQYANPDEAPPSR